MNKKRTFFLIFLGTILAISFFLYFRSGNVSEADSFYHFRHADIYKQTGFWRTDFPWTQYSVINKFSADIWYGFHFILIPFTFFANPVFGLKIAGVFITTVALSLFYWSIARLNVSQRFFWPFLLLFSSPYVSYRLAMARPHVLSVGLGALIFSFSINGNLWGIFFASFALVFFHLSLFWLALLIFGVTAFIRIFTEKMVEWRGALALLAGLAAGWLLRPNPLGAAKIAYSQIILLFIEKQKGVPLRFGMELVPLPMRNLSAFLPFIIIWSFAIFIFLAIAFRLKRKKGASFQQTNLTILLASGVLSVLFFIMTMVIAQRSFDFWTLFGVIFIAFAFSCIIKERKFFSDFKRKAAITFGFSLFAFMAIYGTYKQGEFLNEFAWPPYRFKPAAEWLKNNSEPGDIVFNTSWDYFPELFFWNSRNYYIGGMDPIFQYAYDPKLYWESYYFETGQATRFTCADTFCGPDAPHKPEDTYNVLKRDFKASYMFLSKSYDQNLYDYLLTDSRFFSRYEDGNAAIFQLK